MSQQQPPGWYPDGSGATRYWDGTQWTQQTQAGMPVPAPGQQVAASSVQDEKTMAMLGSSKARPTERPRRPRSSRLDGPAGPGPGEP